MNKKISFLLVLLLALCLTACASTESGGKVSNSPAGSQGELDAEKPKPEEKSPEITFKELTMIDNEACIVKISDIDPDNMWGFTLKANLENKSQDKTYMFAVQSAAVNGVQSDPLFAKEVAPGKKANEDINAIKISKKRTPGTSGKAVPGGIFLHCFVWNIAQTAAVFP